MSEKIFDKFHAEFAEKANGYITTYIQIADTKAAFFFSVCSAIIAFLHTQYGSVIFNLKNLNFFYFFKIINFGCLILAVLFFLLVIRPRLKGSVKGLIFFKSIESYSSSTEYIEDVRNSNEDKIISEKLKHNYELSRICTKKYSYLVFGTWSMYVGLFMTAGYFLIK